MALHDGPASPVTPGQICHLKRIKNDTAARIAHHGMFRLKPVVVGELLQIREVFELAVPEWCLQ